MDELEAGPRHAAFTATIVLVFCCLCWGFAFPATQFTLHAAEKLLPAATIRMELGVSATLNGWRFAVGALLYGLLTARRQRGFRKSELVGGLVLGALVSAGIFAQMVGLHFVRPSVSSFLTALTVVFAPLAQAFILRRPLEARIWPAAALALAGVLILSRPAPETAAVHAFALPPPLPYLGEALTLIGTVLFTAEVFALDHYAPTTDAARLTLIMFVTLAVVSLLTGLCSGGTALYAGDVFGPLWRDASFEWAMGGTIVFSAVAGIHLMNVYQPRMSPARAAVIYCMEPVFATAFSAVFGTETLGPITLVGGVVILASVLTVSLRAMKPQMNAD
jgi:drug/metabolite transporter (DMT)-like permease